MHVVEVDLVDPEALQALLGGLRAVLGGRVHGDALALGVEAELGGQEDVGAALGVQAEPLADEVFAVAVDVGRVPVGAAKLPGAVEQLQASLVGTGCWLAKVHVECKQRTRWLHNRRLLPSDRSRRRVCLGHHGRFDV